MTRAAKLHWIRADDPPDAFPDPASALDSPEGLLAAGGDLSPERLICAYSAGIFPWYEGQPILWWSPDPRAVLCFDDLRVSRSLRKRCRSGRYRVTFDHCFGEVVRGCAAPRGACPDTWITTEMHRAYVTLHELGFAHSVETWEDGRLVGGLYGVALGAVFFGESMFSRASDASKVALVHLTEQLVARDFAFIDCQLPSPHLESLGSRTVPRPQFLRWLRAGLTVGPGPGSWSGWTTAGGAPPRARSEDA